MTTTDPANDDASPGRAARPTTWLTPAPAPTTSTAHHPSPLKVFAGLLAEAADEAWRQAASVPVTGATPGPDLVTGSLEALDYALALRLASAQTFSLLPPGDLEDLDNLAEFEAGEVEALDILPAVPAEIMTQATTELGDATGLVWGGPPTEAVGIDPRTVAQVLGNRGVVDDRGPVGLLRTVERILRRRPIEDLPDGVSSLLVTISDLLWAYAATEPGQGDRRGVGARPAPRAPVPVATDLHDDVPVGRPRRGPKGSMRAGDLETKPRPGGGACPGDEPDPVADA